MRRNDRFKLHGKKPSVVGSGLVALDVVYNENQAEPIGRWTGGTCGNVLNILSWLGWSASPVARLRPGSEASAIRNDLEKWGVTLDFLTEEVAGSTPIILQYIGLNDEGEVFHRFKMRCPVCGNRLPGFRPITGAAVEGMTSRLPDADIFYFDRTSRGILDLATHYYKSGAVVFFEPSSIGEQRHFDEALNMAHIVKFSDNRIRATEVNLPDDYPSLYIETKGGIGLRYRCRFERYRVQKWQYVPAFDVANVRDVAGAGDWCAAGLIYELTRGGVEDFKRQRKSDILSAINLAQAMSAWSCTYEGARGGMYVASLADFKDAVVRILEGRLTLPSQAPPEYHDDDEFACGQCRSMPTITE